MVEKNARNAAVRALLKVNDEDGYSNLVLQNVLSDFSLSARDAALASAVFYGSIEKRMTLDAILAPFLSRPVEKLDAPVREILRTAVYQLFFMDRIPESAAVNEAVNSARQFQSERSSSFVNAVLRSLLRKKEQISVPDTPELRYSCPAELIAFWNKAYGNDITLKILEDLSVRRGVDIRVNTKKTNPEALLARLSDEGVQAEASRILGTCLTLVKSGDLAALTSFSEGLFHVQDLSSQIACSLFPKREGVLYDVCAAPGGKSFTLAEELSGSVCAFDLYKGRVRLIETGAKRLGLSNLRCSVRDATIPEPMEKAEMVLCDAPCSGLGVIRRKPEIRYKKPEMLDSLPDLQYLILCNSADLVKKGGVLMYSTCTLNPGENDRVAERFLSEHTDFAPLALKLPDGLSRERTEPENQITIFPYVCGSDGFFVSLFERR